MPKQIVILDSTQIDAYCTCPSLWNYEYNENVVLDSETKDDIKMGTLGHKWLEIFYRAKALHADIGTAVSAANAFDPDALDVADAHEFPLDKEKRRTVIERLQLYWMKYNKLKDFVPLCKRVHSIEIDSEGNVVDCYKPLPLVEQGFSYELLNTPEYLFVLEGRIDVLTEINGAHHWVDHKFQIRERTLYSKSIQFRNYSLVTGCSIGIINYIRLHKDVKDSTLQRQLVSFGPHEIRAWRSELIDIFIRVAKDLKRASSEGVYAFNKNRAACPGKFGYECQYTHICDEPNPGVAQAIKIEKYKKRKEWRPW